MTGLWFEYLWDKNFSDESDYKCSLWSILEDETNHLALNHIHDVDSDGEFGEIALVWAAKTPQGH